MANKSFLAKSNLKAQYSRNAFDVSFKNVFTSPFGMLLPCGFWRVAPDDYVEIQNENQCISPALKRPTFMRLKEHIDYFFVPASQVWTPSDNFFTGQDYYFSTAIQKIVSNQDYVSKVPRNVPMMSGLGLLEVLKYAYHSTDMWNKSQLMNTNRLLDLLNYGFFRDMQIDDNAQGSELGLDKYPNVNLFALCCYQKVYYDYYRNNQFEQNKVHAYNLDDITSDIGTIDDETVIDNVSRFFDVFEVHYRWLKKDYFTITQTNALANSEMLGFSDMELAVSFATAQPGSTGYNFGVAGIGPSSRIGNTQGSTNIEDTSGLNTGSSVYTNPSSGLSVASIRFAFAYDKLLRRMRVAGQDFDAQMLAQFGIAPIDQRHGKCFRIGGFTNRISTQSVVDTSASGLGNIGGKLDTYSQNMQPLKFHVKEHGFIIGIYSTSVDTDYSGQRISRDNTAGGRYDFFHPIFQNQGLQPIFAFEYDAGDALGFYQNQRQVIGLNKRFSEYKSHIDEVHSLINRMSLDGVDLSMWSSQLLPKLTPKVGSSYKEPLTMRNLVFNPNMLDDVFAESSYTGNWLNDPFVINMYHRVKKISNMSVDGEEY